MLDHIGIHVRDLAAAIAFYRAALAPLDIELCCEDASSAGFGPSGDPRLWLYQGGAPATAVHLAFRAGTRKAVDAFHRAALGAGGGDHGAPGVRADYAPNYYAAFVRDPAGNNVEAVCMAG